MTSRRGGLLVLAGFAAAHFLLGVLGIMVRPHEHGLAGWWPAGGLALVALCWTPRRHWWRLAVVILVTTVAANLVAGPRPLDVSLGFGVANIVESMVSAWCLLQQGVLIRQASDLWRLLGCALVGAVPRALVAATVTEILGGDSWNDAFWTFVIAHPAGVLLVAPMLLIERAPAFQATDRLAEAAVQTLSIAVVVWFVFSSMTPLPLTFLPATIMVWAAARFSPRFTAIEVLVVSLAVALCSVRGYGPFASLPAVIDSPFTGLRLTQLFLVTLLICVMTLSLAVAQRNRTTLDLARSEDLFRRTFDEAMLGMIIVARESDQPRPDHPDQVDVSKDQTQRTSGGSGGSTRWPPGCSASTRARTPPAACCTNPSTTSCPASRHGWPPSPPATRALATTSCSRSASQAGEGRHARCR